jgi:Leucine-rich repeat (LRR) protein
MNSFVSIFAWVAALAGVVTSMMACAMTTTARSEDYRRLDAYAHPFLASFKNRVRDGLDVVSFGVEAPSFGAKLIVGPGGVGAFMGSPFDVEATYGWPKLTVSDSFPLSGIGLRGGTFGVYGSRDNAFGWGTTQKLKISGLAPDMRGKNWDLAVNDSPLPTHAYWRLGIAAGFIVGFRLEVNFGELLDFLVGFVGVDLFGDDLHEDFSALLTQTSFTMNGDDVWSLPAALGDLTQLETIRLEWTAVAALPEQVGKLKQLRTLTLIRNRHLSKLPRSIGSLAALERLELTENGFSSLPDELGQLHALKELEVTESKITSLPAAIGELTNLEKLRISEADISELPRTIGQLTNLRSLVLYHTRVSKLPDEIGALANLEVIDCYWMSPDSLPASIGRLKKLRVLRLVRGSLSVLPAETGELEALEELDLTENGFRAGRALQLPEAIGRLQRLRILKLAMNQMTTLPAAIGSLAALEELDLSRNAFTSLPLEALANLPRSTKILLETNSFDRSELCRIKKALGERAVLGTDGTGLRCD